MVQQNSKSSSSRHIICPQCKKATVSYPPKDNTNQNLFPFCSERCKQLDFGAWLSEDYSVAGPPALDEESLQGFGSDTTDAPEEYHH